MTTEISNYWRLAEELTVHQAVCLMVGKDPQEISEGDRGNEQNIAGYMATKQALVSALEKGSVASTKDEGLPVDVESLKKWLSSKGFKDGFFFPDSKPDIDYLDKSHPHYAPKLAAAIKAWQAVENEPAYQDNGKSVKENLINWLMSHAAEFSLTKADGEINKSAIEDQVAMVANWDTKGGAPTTPSKESDHNDDK